MAYSFNTILLIGSFLLFVAIIVSKTTSRISIPSILFFIAIGFLAGSDFFGIYFDNVGFSQNIGIVALTLILFSGGLDTKWETIKPVFLQAGVLSTLGVLITTLAVGLFVNKVFDFSIFEGLLLGAIVSSTDAAAVFSILKSKNIGLRRRIGPLLELESGSNDPMAYFLTISFTYLITNPEASVYSLIPNFFKEMALGALIGLSFGWLMVWIMSNVKLTIEGLYYVLVFSIVFLTYSFAQFIHGNGFLAVYIAGIMLGRAEFIHKKNIIRFYDGQAWLFQITMFILLGLLAFPKQIIPVMSEGIAISLFLIFIARPLGVFASLSLTGQFNFKEKLFISWVGLRGAVPIIFATYPLMAGIEKANLIFNIVFFIVITSVMVQGSTVEFLAKKLKLYKPAEVKRKFPVDSNLEDNISNELADIIVPENSGSIGKTIKELKLPSHSLIALIERHSIYIKPRPNTRIEKGDKLIFISKEENEFMDIIKVIHKK